MIYFPAAKLDEKCYHDDACLTYDDNARCLQVSLALVSRIDSSVNRTFVGIRKLGLIPESNPRSKSKLELLASS